MSKRKSRSTAIETKPDMLKPLDLSLFGGPEDPCFGKHHDLKAPECRECGDREICAIALAQKRRVDRTELEKVQPFKDIEDSPKPPDEARLLRYMQKKVDKGYERKVVIRKVMARFEITKGKAKELYNKL